MKLLPVITLVAEQHWHKLFLHNQKLKFKCHVAARTVLKTFIYTHNNFYNLLMIIV